LRCTNKNVRKVTVYDFKNIKQFLDKLSTADGYDYAVEFRHPSWGTEGPWEMLRHYNIAAVMTDSPPRENLQFLSDVIVTANQSFLNLTEEIPKVITGIIICIPNKNRNHG
jgi:uncharacterized protein YecE (DUF72 family)